MNWHEARTEQHLREANDALRSVNDHLWELNQPPEVRAALQAARARRARVTTFGVRVVLALAAAWVVLSLVFGRAGQRVFGGVLAFAWHALDVLLVVGFFVAIGISLLRVVRAVTRVGRGGTGDSP